MIPKCLFHESPILRKPRAKIKEIKREKLNKGRMTMESMPMKNIQKSIIMKKLCSSMYCPQINVDTIPRAIMIGFKTFFNIEPPYKEDITFFETVGEFVKRKLNFTTDFPINILGIATFMHVVSICDKNHIKNAKIPG